MGKDAGKLQLLKAVSESRVNGNELGILHLHREMLNATRVSFVVLLIEAVYFIANNRIISPAFYDARFYGLGEQLLHRLYDLRDEFIKSLKGCFRVHE